MGKNKRKSVPENADEKKKKDAKAVNGKGLRAGAATLTICAAAFGAYYSPHFRAASSDWLELGRSFFGKPSSTDVDLDEGDAAADAEMREKLAQAPSFRDFLTDEYGEEGARELLGIDEAAADVPTVASGGGGFADYVVAETASSESVAPQDVANDVDASSLPPAPESAPSFADYVAAETASSESVAPQDVANDVDASSLPPAPESAPSFADYVAAESAVEREFAGTKANAEKTRLASATEAVAPMAIGDAEIAVAARLQEEMKERGVGNPRIERWGGRFWRASGFATTREGVATFCEAVDVDPASAQRAALTKFDAARF